MTFLTNGDFPIQFSVYTKLSHTPRILSLGSLWEELVRIQNGGLTTQRDTEKRCESLLIWAIFNRNFTFKRVIVSIFHLILRFFFHVSRRSELIRVDPPRTGDLSWSGPTFVPASKELNSRPKRVFFIAPETISKVDDIKIKREVSPFFLPLPSYLPFIALLSLFFARLHGLEKALRFSEIKVWVRVL